MQSRRNAPSSGVGVSQVLVLILVTSTALGTAEAAQQHVFQRGWQGNFLRLTKGPTVAKRGPPEDQEGRIPMHITNRCEDTMWPGIATQSGTGPGVGGWEQEPGNTTKLWVSSDWQGRIWGRTNCTVDGSSASCETGDCFGELDCEFGGSTPATLAEFTLAGGKDGHQTFYDLSLVDGYNIPLSINYIPSKNTTFVPPNLTNCACIATPGWLHAPNQTGVIYSNSSYPIPWEMYETNESVERWCPWPYLALPPTKPGDGIFPYPDDNIRRPAFSPCNSACAASGKDKDCCVGKYHDPKICRPSRYSMAAKAICPDAYSFAFDDQESTFIMPKGGGWEVVMCPEGRSTNILRQLGAELFQLASDGKLSELSVARLRNTTYINEDKVSTAASLGPTLLAMVAIALSLLVHCA